MLLFSDMVGERTNATKVQEFAVKDVDGSLNPTKAKGKRLVHLASLDLEAIGREQLVKQRR